MYDLVLLDLKMPGMDGLEVLRFIRKNGIDAQVILLTAHGSLESAIGALREGAHDYLLKPCPPKDILASVEAGLKRRAESVQRETLLDQLEKSVQALRGPTASTNSYDTTTPAATRPEQETETRLRITEGIWLDVMRREIHYGAERVRLTPAEGRLMQILLENPGAGLAQSAFVSTFSIIPQLIGPLGRCHSGAEQRIRQGKCVLPMAKARDDAILRRRHHLSIGCSEKPEFLRYLMNSEG